MSDFDKHMKEVMKNHDTTLKRLAESERIDHKIYRAIKYLQVICFIVTLCMISVLWKYI